MEHNSKISGVLNPNEIEMARFRNMEIRFQCLVKMFDSGFVQRKNPMPFLPATTPPPQWFKSETKLTMEFVEYADAETIGRVIKEAFYKLKNHIESYEQERSGL